VFCLPACACFCSLLANSALISRYAALRANALALPGAAAAAVLYGPSLTLAQPAAAAAVDSGAAAGNGSSVVTGTGQLYDSVAELELRLSGTMGIEVRVCT
jgi:hypothetical protein